VLSHKASGATLTLMWNHFPARWSRMPAQVFLIVPASFWLLALNFFAFPGLRTKSRLCHVFPPAAEFPCARLLLAQFLIFCSISFSLVEDSVALRPAPVITKTRAFMLLAAGSPSRVGFPVCCQCSSSCSNNIQSLLFGVGRSSEGNFFHQLCVSHFRCSRVPQYHS
jgi:hypothetical protein